MPAVLDFLGSEYSELLALQCSLMTDLLMTWFAINIAFANFAVVYNSHVCNTIT